MKGLLSGALMDAVSITALLLTGACVGVLILCGIIVAFLNWQLGH